MIEIGNRLDNKYQVVKMLGCGGFGEVFLANDDTIPDRQVAIKVLLPSSTGDHSDLIWEMRVLAQFNHPGISIFYHHFNDGDRLFLVMEYCSGGNLREKILKNGKCAEAETFRWVLTLCDTLAFVHEKGIVHHDIKPENILFTKNFSVKIGDFGVSNRNAGTPTYMSPEIFLGEYTSKTDPRVDIYALGLTLLESLIGVNPFLKMDRSEILYSKIRHDFIPRELSNWVQEVLLKATHPTPELRFQTMQDFGDAIRGKHVSWVFDINKIKAHEIAQKVENWYLPRKKWKTAEKMLNNALSISGDCVAALIAAGRCQLLFRNIDRADEYFSKAVTINPRANIQKELGWIAVEKGDFPTAISLLTDYLDRNTSDYEAFNLLLKCFFLSGRYDVGYDVSETLIKSNPDIDCFYCNQVAFEILSGNYEEGKKIGKQFKQNNQFVEHNIKVATEDPASWSPKGFPSLKSKMIFQEYRFSINKNKKNTVRIDIQEKKELFFSNQIITIGFFKANDITLNHNSVSRRHAAIVNLLDEVWIYDLGSTNGITVDDIPVSVCMLLNGVHRIKFGDFSLEATVREDVLF